MSYHELKQRLEKLQDTDFTDNYRETVFELNDLAENMLYELLASERSLYLLKRNVPPEVSSYYPRITKDPTISCYKDNQLIDTQSLDNPDFTKLYELGLYALSDGDYCIRTVEQLGYISNFLEGEMREVVDFKDYHYEINFD